MGPDKERMHAEPSVPGIGGCNLQEYSQSSYEAELITPILLARKWRLGEVE